MPDRISDNQGRRLIALARQTIAQDLGLCTSHGVQDGTCAAAGTCDDAGICDNGLLHEKRGLFVSLHKQGQLRGCIGTIEPVSSVQEALLENARAAAFRDSRFAPLKQDEFDDVDIEISILSPPRVLEYEDSEQLSRLLVPNRDGVVLKKGMRRATFLPQVWEQLPIVAQFLSHLCMKADLPSDAWQTGPLEISVYQVQSFGENNS
jgi:AmmeMemoRadiSam system protein A